MATGKIKWFDAKKGFGFITPDEGGKDAFLHVSALQAANISSVTDGQAVEDIAALGKVCPLSVAV